MKRDPLAWAALCAAIVVTASAEYQLARACGFDRWVAAGVPAALDIYAVRALRARRDVLAVVVAMIAVNAASHLVSAGLVPVNVPLVVAVSAIAPLVMWRVHALREVVAEPVSGSAPEPQPELAEPEAELTRLDEVPPRPEQAPRVPVLGDFAPLLPLPPGFSRTGSGTAGTSGGTGQDQAGSRGREATGPEPQPEPEPAERPGGTSGTGGGSGAGDIESSDSENTRFRAHVERARNWLAEEPELSGTAIGARLGTSDSYGRRVRRAVLAGR